MTDAPTVSYGLQGVVVDDSRICKVDGVEGKLYYYGYSIFELAENCSYEEVVYLLLKGELPNAEQLAGITKELTDARGMAFGVKDVIKSAPESSIPMDVLRTAASAVALTDPNPTDNSEDARYRKAIRLIAQFPEIVAADYRHRQGKELVEPDPSLGHAANFLYLLHGEKAGEKAVKVMDVALILHAEHSFNASTFTGRVVASTLSDMYSAIAAAVGALKGPLHGGANEGVIKTLLEIGDMENIEPWLNERLSQKGFRLMGFGHRVYKVLDPRAVVLKKFSKAAGEERGNSKWFEMSEKIEGIMKNNDKKVLYPNVDFYSASTYYSMDLPPEIFTPIFAVSRIAGWCAHVIEQQGDNKLIRPKANYIGDVDRPFTALAER
ncbi:citrate/2-methylcitrate synthase [Planctomycetota bacterium]|nr:citrate/2-methylcitrate synthase [Planctomycetota bacterium]